MALAVGNFRKVGRTGRRSIKNEKRVQMFFGNLELNANYSEIKLMIEYHFKNNT